MKTTYKLQQKIFITLLILLIARFGIFIPIPGIDHEAFNNSIKHNSIINFLNVFSGGGFSTIGIFALGIVPYINSSIIMQLIIKIVPELENLQKEEGENGRQKITQITRYLTLLWALLQSISIALWVKPYVFDWNNYFILDCTVTLTTGSMIIMWFSEIITEFGIGNGASLLIFQNIVSSIPKNFKTYTIDSYNQDKIVALSLVIIFCIITLTITILIQEGRRKILIVSARQLGQINELNPQSYIPLKLNQGGVMPIVFASAAMALPSYLSQILSASPIVVQKAVSLFLPNSFLYLPLYCLLIICFSYFYSSLILNPQEIAKNLKKMGASIPNIRPGTDTIQYLKQRINKLTFLGAIFLFLIALLPSIASSITSINAFRGLGATSLLILVGVAIDTAKQIQTYIISQQYDNMME
uniref:Protein translocase subunit SecY n=1 Tax=Schimmelmannia schousboei TaxID=173468 RepID=A0A1C9C8Z6_9FLOR|nr:preprotein translocase subunit SecY [Schimmelmannia schousboei]AOM64866.1 preprotein translocase subunit SecY [Schimmelmannia schousboei]